MRIQWRGCVKFWSWTLSAATHNSSCWKDQAGLAASPKCVFIASRRRFPTFTCMRSCDSMEANECSLWYCYVNARYDQGLFLKRFPWLRIDCVWTRTPAKSFFLLQFCSKIKQHGRSLPRLPTRIPTHISLPGSWKWCAIAAPQPLLAKCVGGDTLRPIDRRGNRSSKVCHLIMRNHQRLCVQASERSVSGLPHQSPKTETPWESRGKLRRGEASQIKVSPSLIPPACSCAESASKENQPVQMSAGEDLGWNCGVELKQQASFSSLN